MQLALLGVLAILCAASAGDGGYSPLVTRLLTPGCRVGCFSSTSGGCGGPASSNRVTLTGGSRGITVSPLVVTFTGVIPRFFLCFIMFFGSTAFYVAFIFIMPTLAATSASYCAAEIVLVLLLLSILSLLLALQLEQAGSSPIAVGPVAWCTFIVRRMNSISRSIKSF